MAALSSAITVGLKEWGWIEDSPFRKINTLRESRGRVRCLDEEERKRLLEACMERSRLLYVVLVVALSSGARKNEIMTLKWSQVDLTHGLFTLHETKNSEWRSVPLQGRALELVRELAKVRRLDTDLLFPSHKDPNKPLSINTIWKRAVKDAGLVDFRFHDTRHCAASYLLMSGATLAELSELLGHKSLQMVKRYSHMTTPHAAKIVEKMNREIFG
jgi:integrase